MRLRIRQTGIVAGREIRAILTNKYFYLEVFLPIAFLWAFLLIISLREQGVLGSLRNRSEPVRVGILHSDPRTVEAWCAALGEQKLSNGLPLFEFHPVSRPDISAETAKADAREKVRAKEWDAFVVLTGDVAEQGRCDFYSLRGFDISLPRGLQRSLADVVRQQRLEANGLDPTRVFYLTRGISWTEFEIPAEADADALADRKADFSSIFSAAFICVMMMLSLIFATSGRLLWGILEEKHSRLAEVLLSSLSPPEILGGKVIGFYIIGLIEFTLWVGFGTVTLQARNSPIVDLIPPAYFLQFMIFLTTGYLFFASLFAAIGAIVGNETESQLLLGFICGLIMLPMWFGYICVTQPDWWPVRFASFFPFFTPALMALRTLAAPVPWWEILLVAFSTLLFALLWIWVAARIFRVGILLTGKRPGVRELVRWCLYRDVSGVVET